MQLNKFILPFLICTLFSCEGEYIYDDVEPNINGIINDDNFPYPCLDGECNTLFEIDTLVSPGAYLDDNGYWHVEFNGLFYFFELTLMRYNSLRRLWVLCKLEAVVAAVITTGQIYSLIEVREIVKV